MTHSFFFTALLAMAIASPVQAQQGSPVVNAKLRLLSFSPEMDTTEIYIHDPAAPPETAAIQAELKSYLNNQAYPVPLKSRKVVFTSSNERASLAKDDQVLGEVTLPAGGDSSILLFLPGRPGGKAKYQLMAVADSIRAFPAGSFHVTNLSPVPVRLELEKKPFDFKPGQATLIENPPAKANSQMGMRAFVQDGESWKEISSSIWAHPGRGRSFMLLFQEPGTTDVRLRSFSDVPPRAEQAAPATAGGTPPP